MFGVAVDIVTAVGLIWVFRRRGWLGGPTV